MAAPSPIRRAAREEARVWPAALALVLAYLLIADWHAPDVATQPPAQIEEAVR